MSIVNLPNNWQRREYQKPLWEYLKNNGDRAIEIAHRRWGKDDVSLHHTACAAHERIGNYGHCLPEYAQARKAIWTAVNPHTGKKRIDEAFPPEIRKRTNDHEMFIELKCGSSWQVLGSDQYDRLVGTAFAGITFSEWALANPSAWGYTQPILEENNGWAIFITTPRGRNHAKRMFDMAKTNPRWYAELSDVQKTGVFTAEQLENARQELIAIYGEDIGNAQFEQEYYCSFDAAILGAVWGAELRKLEQEGRFTPVPHDPDYPVFTAWDIGRKDATAVWFFQVIANEVRMIDFQQATLKDPDYFASQVLGIEVKINFIDGDIRVVKGDPIEGLEYRREYRYAKHFLPHDAKAKTFQAKGKSLQEQFAAVFGWDGLRVIPALAKQDQIQAARKLINQAVFDESTEEGFDAIKQYRYEWDDAKKSFKYSPVHDWTSHPSDALMTAAIGFVTEKPQVIEETPPIKGTESLTLNDLWKTQKKRKRI